MMNTMVRGFLFPTTDTPSTVSTIHLETSQLSAAKNIDPREPQWICKEDYIIEGAMR
jgi:hypothetical protein